MKITSEHLENNQIYIYAFTIITASTLGLISDSFAASLTWTISPCLALLMYSMFLQLPFSFVNNALPNKRFILALLLGNFIIIPLFVWILTSLFTLSLPAIIGIYLVLLTPCIDYVVVFTHLGKGNAKLLLAVTPLLLLIQMVCLPLYLWLFIGDGIFGIIHLIPFLKAFLVIIVLPLVSAMFTQYIAKHFQQGKKFIHRSAWFPVPLMALVLFVVITSQMGRLYHDAIHLVEVLPVYILFIIVTPLLGYLLTRLFTLEIGAGRALTFSMSTRNSLVVLPLAFALPTQLATIAVAVIIMQTIFELIAEIIYIYVIPTWLIK